MYTKPLAEETNAIRSRNTTAEVYKKSEQKVTPTTSDSKVTNKIG